MRALIYRIKNYWNASTASRKTSIVGGGVAVLLFAVVGSIILQASHADVITVASLEGESMTVTKGRGSIVTDNGVTSLKLTRSGATAVGTMDASEDITGVELTIRGDQCKGAPKVRLLLDGQQILQSVISNTTFQTVSNNISFAKGSHKLTAKLTNYLSSGKCARALYIDVTKLDGVSIPLDSAPPVVSISSPTDTSTVNGTVNITANATDDIGVTKVEFYINGNLVDTVAAAPYSYSWNTTTGADGDYALVARAYDAAGNTGTSSIVSVKVANAGVSTASGPFIAYPVTSFFRTPLGSNWPVDPTSDTGIAFAKANDPNPYPMLRGVGGNQWGVGFALGTCSDPIWKFDTTAKLPAGQSFLTTEGFHAPQGWEKNIPQNNDAPIEIIDTCGVPSRPKGFTVWGANVYYDGNANRILTTNPASNSGAIIGGSFSHDTNGLNYGVANSTDTTDLNETSRGNIPDSFGIRDDLLQYGMQGGNNGTLGHVLQMFWIETDSAMGNVAPMSGHENNRAGYGAEGERIALKPTWTPPSTCTGAALVVARTLQDYGAYLGNNSGSGSGIKVQQNSTLLSPRSLGACFTWDDMAFVQQGWSASW